MAPPPSQTCSKEDCDYTTPPGIPTWELVFKALEIHASSCHGAQPVQAGRAETKHKFEKLPRPTFSLDMTEGDWAYSTMQWSSYIAQAPATPEEQLLQLRAACEDSLLRHVYESGDFDSVNTVH